MLDPRCQGWAGAVRIVHGILGGKNPRCINVAKWRTMTPEQLARQYIDVKTIEETARHHHCGPG
ncbi:MAG TPA: hypothetical protein VF271_08705 [Rhodanobacteraceae bacterium]